MKPSTLFGLEDKILKLPGLYAMWTCLFISNFITLLSDDTVGASRDFNIWANGISVLYCGFAGLNTIYGNGLPSTMLVTIGPIHQYAYWLLFAYFKPGNVLGEHPIGVINWVNTVIVGLFSIDMIVKTWYTTLYPASYKQYVLETTQDRVPQREVRV